jgi:hypothetical protein
VNMKRRVERLEGIQQPGETRFAFEIVHPPEGLTRQQEDQWREEHRRDCETRGVLSFTLDLGAAKVRRGDDE